MDNWYEYSNGLNCIICAWAWACAWALADELPSPCCSPINKMKTELIKLQRNVTIFAITVPLKTCWWNACKIDAFTFPPKFPKFPKLAIAFNCAAAAALFIVSCDTGMVCLDRDTVGDGAGEAGGGGGGVGRGCGVTDLVIESCGGWTGTEIGVDIGAGESIGDMLPWVANRCSISCS